MACRDDIFVAIGSLSILIFFFIFVCVLSNELYFQLHVDNFFLLKELKKDIRAHYYLLAYAKIEIKWKKIKIYKQNEAWPIATNIASRHMLLLFLVSLVKWNLFAATVRPFRLLNEYTIIYFHTWKYKRKMKEKNKK